MREFSLDAGAACSGPMFADAHLSLVFDYGRGYHVDGLWESSEPGARLLGSMTAGRPASPGEPWNTVGVYFRASSIRTVTKIPAGELTDQIVPLEDLWGDAAQEWSERIAELQGDEDRVNALEQALVERFASPGQKRASALDAAGLAQLALNSRGRITVDELAKAGGVSRQHLTRVFREEIGVSPKVYCRLARFRSALALAGAPGTNWADAALELGYSDQSHMISEFREFTGLTPGSLTADRYFHPFVKG
jgi:AraC-like DNA-binding protein